MGKRGEEEKRGLINPNCESSDLPKLTRLFSFSPLPLFFLSLQLLAHAAAQFLAQPFDFSHLVFDALKERSLGFDAFVNQKGGSFSP